MTMSTAPLEPAPPRPQGDYVTGAITGGAIILFVGTGSTVLGSVLRSLAGNGGDVDEMQLVAMLLNIAIILLGWRGYRHKVHEVRDLAAAGQRAEKLAAHDPLTGLINRHSFTEQGAALVSLAEDRGKAVALLMLDLDDFKTVNDMHGHRIGDALLRQVADDIAQVLPASALTARLGGDEFGCAMLFDPAHPDSVERVAKALVRRLSRAVTVDGHLLTISASCGLARSDQDCDTMDVLMREADIAMYAAKKAGRNRYAWFDRSMERAIQARNEIETGLRNAIPQGQIVPYFEQQVDLATGALAGFEVLARWEHPLRGLVEPDQFIPIAEETGLIADLSMSVMRQAFIAARDWDPELVLAVNISPWQLKDAWLAQKIIKLLLETGFPARRLEIEITESALFDNLALAQSIAVSLKNQGIRLALDDFGTGYSSLAHLRALPFDRIKIDKCFVGSIAEKLESAAIVGAIARLGESLNMPTTAEGVEDADTLERLRAMGCARAQGYHFGRPVSAANVRRLLADRRLIAQGPQRLAG
jgi:diguanylate cyclase (GGDEF)-like protein